MQNVPYDTNNRTTNPALEHEVHDHIWGHKHSGVSWAAIFAGGVATVAISTLLMFFGSGVGFSSTSPWSNEGMTAGQITAFAAIWLIIMQWIASAVGGYVAGRLRCRGHHHLHSDESCFRDSVHGFLAWSIAMLLTVGVVALVSATTLRAGHTLMKDHSTPDRQNTVHAMSGNNPASYYVDHLYRTDKSDVTVADQDVRAESARILIKNVKNDDLLPADKAYLTQLVAAKTGLSASDAEARVNAVVAEEKADEAEARRIADEARKASAKITFYTFFSMLVGAFIASAAGVLGGCHREDYCALSKKECRLD